MRIVTISTIRHRTPDLDGLIDDDRDGDPDGYFDDDPDGEIYLDDGADDGYGELLWPDDRRWRPVVATLGIVVAVGAIATAVIINSGGSAAPKARVAPAPRTLTTTPRSTSPSASPSMTREPQLPPETFTPVPPPPNAGPTDENTDAPTPTAAPAPAVVPPPLTLDPRTVVYTVTGTKQLLDLVNIVYTDARGYPKTEFNVTLPWARMIVLNPGVQTQSVIATSLYARLNCSIRNADGQTVVASIHNSRLATCTR